MDTIYGIMNYTPNTRREQNKEIITNITLNGLRWLKYSGRVDENYVQKEFKL